MTPLNITLHLHSPPSDKLLLGSSVDACRSNFMNMVKEADFVRWGSTRRVTALRKVDQDALWEGVMNREFVSTRHHLSGELKSSLVDDFDRFWSIAAKLVPSPALPLPASTSGGSIHAQSMAAAPSTLNSGDRLPDANAMRSVPVRIYLPGDLPVMQDLVPPLSQDGDSKPFYSSHRSSFV